MYFQLSPAINISLLKMKSKDYYWPFIDKLDVELKSPKKWIRDLQLAYLNLTVYFKTLTNACNKKKLREFYFKLLHKIVVRKKVLYNSFLV